MPDNSRAKETEAFYSKALGYVQKYFLPNSAAISVVSFDDPHDEFSSFSPRVTGLHSGLAEMYRDIASNGGFSEVPSNIIVNIPITEPIAQTSDGNTMQIHGGRKYIVNSHNVVGLLHEDRYMDSLLADLKRCGVNDAFVIGMATGRTGITKTGMYGDNVRKRAEEFGKKALPWLIERQHVQEPLIIGIPPLGFAFGKYIMEETKGQCHDYSGALGTARVMTLDREKVADRDVVIIDSWFTTACDERLGKGKQQLGGLGANRVFYIAESGPFGHPLVDFSANVTQYL